LQWKQLSYENRRKPRRSDWLEIAPEIPWMLGIAEPFTRRRRVGALRNIALVIKLFPLSVYLFVDGFEKRRIENSMPRSMHDGWLNMQNGAWRMKRNAIRSRGSRAACFVVATHGMPKLLHVININALHARQQRAKRGRGRDAWDTSRTVRYCCVHCAHLQRDCVNAIDILGEFFNRVYFIFAVRESAVFAADRIAGSRLRATCITL